MPSQQYVGINVTTPVLSDVRVRRAIAYAIDRERILDVYRGADTPEICRGRGGPGIPARRQRDLHRDPTRAALPRQVGPIPPLSLDFSTQGVDRVIAEIVPVNLKDVGITVDLVPNDQTQQASKLIGGKFTGLWLLQHGFAQFTPSTLAVSAYPFNAAKNSSNYVNPAYAAASRGGVDRAGRIVAGRPGRLSPTRRHLAA